jgi:hypothetical protein
MVKIDKKVSAKMIERNGCHLKLNKLYLLLKLKERLY